MSTLSDGYMRGIPTKPYDMVREGLFVLCGIALLVTLLAAVWGFPRIPPLTLQQAATEAPVAFTRRTLSYLDGQAGLLRYGPPYTANDANAQHVGPICPACWVGVAHPINFRKALVMAPLGRAARLDPALGAALAAYRQAAPAQRRAWTTAYHAALARAHAAHGTITLPPGTYGPVPQLMTGMLELAQSGLLEGALVEGVHPGHAPYDTNYTLPLFYLGGPRLMGAVATHFDEQGSEWGMSHVAGPYPGAWWLWPYTFLYQIPAIGNSPAADLIAGMIIGAVALVLFFLPFVPGLNRVPYLVPIYRIIWRDWYARYPSGDPTRGARRADPG